MINTKIPQEFYEFTDKLIESDEVPFITATYDFGKTMVSFQLENSICSIQNKESLYIESSNAINLLLHKNDIYGIEFEGYDALVDKNTYKVELVNNMILYVSIS